MPAVPTGGHSVSSDINPSTPASAIAILSDPPPAIPTGGHANSDDLNPAVPSAPIAISGDN